MTYAKPEQPVLRTPRRRPAAVARATRKLLTRCAADSVSDIDISFGKVSVSPFYNFLGAFKTRLQRIFDHQQPAQFLHRHLKGARPVGGRAERQGAQRSAGQVPREPRRYRQSMGAAVGLKTCISHSAFSDSEVEAHPGLCRGISRLPANDPRPLQRSSPRQPRKEPSGLRTQYVKFNCGIIFVYRVGIRGYIRQ